MCNLSSVDLQLGVSFLVLHDDLHALVVTALLAHAVGQLHLVALGALNDAGQRELPVSLTAVLRALEIFPLGVAIVTPPHPFMGQPIADLSFLRCQTFQPATAAMPQKDAEHSVRPGKA